MTEIVGTCHCEACRWTLSGDPGSITACNCTLCRRYGALWAYDYDGETYFAVAVTKSASADDKDASGAKSRA